MWIQSRRGGLVVALFALCVAGADRRSERVDRRKVVKLDAYVESFEHADLVSKVSGYVSRLLVDIGSRVKKGDTLAEIDVPELRADLDRSRAALEATRAEAETASATLRIARENIRWAEQCLRRAQLGCKRRQAQYVRCQEACKRLAASSGDAGREALRKAEEALADADQAREEADVELAMQQRKLARCQAELSRDESLRMEATAKVNLARVDVERASALVDLATIRAPFDGVITTRTSSLGDFVRGSGQPTPLLTLNGLDRFRVVVPVPDKQAGAVREGMPAEVEIDALPGKRFRAKVSRMSFSLSSEKTMRVEIDLDNPRGEIFHGLSAHAFMDLGQPPGEEDRGKGP